MPIPGGKDDLRQVPRSLFPTRYARRDQNGDALLRPSHAPQTPYPGNASLPGSEKERADSLQEKYRTESPVNSSGGRSSRIQETIQAWIPAEPA